MHILQRSGFGAQCGESDVWRNPDAGPPAGDHSEHSQPRRGSGRPSAGFQRRTKMRNILFAMVVAGFAALLLAGCSISVDDKDKKNAKVDIRTPLADLKVNTDEKAATDNGIPVYPGAHLRPTENGDNHAANVNIGAMGFGLKVVAAEYETDDSPERVKAFYQDKLKTFGNVLVCNEHIGGSDVHIDSKCDN